MRPATRIVELRRYALHPGARETLIELFDRELVETQEAVGMQVIGQFRDCDHPDRFVWLRGFPDMASRRNALAAFYGGPVWAEHRDAANATMIDSDDVLLLRPARTGSGFDVGDRERQPPGARGVRAGLVAVTVCYLDEPAGDDLVARFERDVEPALASTDASLLGYFATESSPNDYPALPVREENVFAWAARVSGEGAFERYRAAAGRSLLPRVRGEPEVLKLSPTARSLL